MYLYSSVDTTNYLSLPLKSNFLGVLIDTVVDYTFLSSENLHEVFILLIRNRVRLSP